MTFVRNSCVDMCGDKDCPYSHGPTLFLFGRAFFLKRPFAWLRMGKATEF